MLKNSKMSRRQNFAMRTSKAILGNPRPCKELTKATGRKSDRLCDHLPDFQTIASAPLQNSVRSEKRTFSTVSTPLGHQVALVQREPVIR
jgi:hypothetical protein